MPDYYDTAQVCINGHIITDSVQISPQINQKFCDICGSPLITKCPHCKADLRGRKHIKDVTSMSGGRVVYLNKAEHFCYQCGKPYPWLESKLQDARELINDLEGISVEEKDVLTKSIDEIIKETPKTEIAAIKFKKILSKYSKPIVEAFRNILIDIVSETTKKLIWPV